MKSSTMLACLVLMAATTAVLAKKAAEKPDWAKKDPIHYSDADVERLLDEWNEDDEDDGEDDDPRKQPPPPAIDLNNFDPKNPESFLKMSKKGQTLMTFCTISPPATRERTEELSSLWQTALHNNHIQVDRFILSDDRFLFMFKDGAQAWDAKDYLIEQEGLEQMTLENKPYYGKYAKQKAETETGDKDEL